MYTKLHQELKKRCLSVNKLSFMSGITASDLYCALSGKKPMYPNWRKRIAEALDMSIEELFDEEERADVLID